MPRTGPGVSFRHGPGMGRAMNKCLCILAIAGLLAGCRAPYNLANFRFDRTRLAASLRQTDEAPGNEEPAPADDEQDLKTAAHEKSDATNSSALVELASARKPDESAAENLRRGNAAAAAGDIDKARAFYERIIAVEPKHAQAHHRLAVLADQRADYETAARYYMVALQQEPASADLLNDIGYSFFLQGRLETAQRYLEDAVRAQPSHTRAKANLALVRKRAELIASASSATKATEPPATTPPADPSEWLDEQVATSSPQAVTAHQRESAYPPESPNPVQTVAGESAPGIAKLRPALPKIRPHNSDADLATDLFTPVVTPLGENFEPPALGAQQVRVPIPPLPAPPNRPMAPTAFPVSLRSPVAAPPSDDLPPDTAAPLAVPPARDPLITAELAQSSARYIGMSTGPGNPFSAINPNRPAEVPPVALTPGGPPGALLAAASPMTAPRVRITGVTAIPDSAQPQPHHATSGITLASNSQFTAGHDPIEQFQREVQEHYAQRNEIDLRREGSVIPAGGTFPSTGGVRHASWPEADAEPQSPQAPTTTSGW